MHRIRKCAACGKTKRVRYMFYEVERHRNKEPDWAIELSEYDDSYDEFPLKIFCSISCALTGVREWANSRKGSKPEVGKKIAPVRKR